MATLIKKLDVFKVGRKLTNLIRNKFDYDDFMRMLILEESKIGSQIFGARKPGYRRDFFMLDESTWVWNEQIDTSTGQHIVTTRYVIESDKIYKTQDGGPYELLFGEELEHFYSAVQIYDQKARALYATL